MPLWRIDATKRPTSTAPATPEKPGSKITAGLPAGWIANAIREDTVRKGLLYAALSNGVYVSFDDGDHWQSLQLNLPTSDARDLVIHDNDLVVATYGRALWILDDLSPLRQASSQIANADAALLRPATVTRIRWDNDQETPLPPEFPAAQNPPDGAIFYYTLKSAPSADITLEIHDAQGNLIRRFSSATPAPDTVVKNVPDYWFGPQAQLPKNPGLNRFAWDLHFEPPPALQYSYYGQPLKYLEYTLSDHAIPGETPREQVLGPLVPPGQYEIVLNANGQTVRQTLTVVPDPRVHIAPADYIAQYSAAKRADSGLRASYATFQEVAALRKAMTEREESLDAILKPKAEAATALKSAPAANASGAHSQPASEAAAPPLKDAAEALKNLDAKIAEILAGSNGSEGIGTVNRDLARTSFMIDSGDAAPAPTALEVIDESCTSLNKSLSRMAHAELRHPPLRQFRAGQSKSRPSANRIATSVSHRIITSASKRNPSLNANCIVRSTVNCVTKHNRNRQHRRLPHVEIARSFPSVGGTACRARSRHRHPQPACHPDRSGGISLPPFSGSFDVAVAFDVALASAATTTPSSS